MKLRCGVALMLWPLMLSAHAADFHPPLRVVSAKLYARHAEVLRQTQIEISEAGVHRIWLAEPLQGGEGMGDVQIKGARVLSKTLRPDEHALIANEAERVMAARLRLEGTRRALDDNERLAAAWSRRLEQADGNGEEIKAMLAQLAEEYKSLMHRHLEAERALLRARAVEDWEGGGEKLSLAIAVDVMVDEPGSIHVQWREQTNDVFWLPKMRLALDSASGKVRWQAEAAITQQSGVDFDNVQLRLALAAAQDAEKPAFQPLILRLGEERQSLQERAIATLDIPASIPQSAASDVQVVNHGSIREVVLPGRYGLPSGTHQTVVRYGEGEADAEVYRAVYTWDKPERAIVMADFKLPQIAAFVPGDVQLYRDEALVAHRAMPQAWSSHEALSLSFGEDINFRVKQHYPSDYKDSKGVIAKENVLDYAQSVEVDNQSGSAQTLRIYALLPVAGEKDIVVKPAWPQMPESSDAEGIKGVVYWQKTLADGESWKLDHGYSVSYPDGKQLIGF